MKYSESGDIKGVCLIVHGLNLKPDKMLSICDLFLGEGIKTVNVSLSGHDGNFDKLKNITLDTWIRDLYSAYVFAKSISEKKAAPFYFSGFSLGAMLNLLMIKMFDKENISYDKMILFAPAFGLKSNANILKLLRPFPKLVLPSFNDPEYRVYPGIPVAAYNALFKGVKCLKNLKVGKEYPPSLCFIDEHDELVSLKKISRFIKKMNNNKWKLIALNNKTSVKKLANHLIVDEDSCGQKDWMKIKKEVKAFIN